MTWRDEYRQASFRGVPFKVKTADSSFGRRQVVHEFPQVDIPYSEDLGRQADEFTIEGYVLGEWVDGKYQNNYHVGLAALIKACRDEIGPGTLVHPYRGEKVVVCRGLRVRESTDEGGMATLSITFLEAGEPLLPAVQVDPPAAVEDAADTVREEAKRSFVERYVTDGMPGHVLDAAKAKVSAFSDRMAAIKDFVIDNAQAAADFAYGVQQLGAQVNDLVTAPADLVALVDSTIGTMRRAFRNADKHLRDIVDTYAGEDDLVAVTPSRQQQQENDNAWRELLRQLALAQWCSIEANAEHDSYQDASGVRDDLTTRLDTEAEATADDGVYSALLAMRATVVTSIPPPGQTLPYLITYTPRITLPSLVIAHQLYGDAARSDEIVARNRPVHPGFMPGGRPIEVLSDG